MADESNEMGFGSFVSSDEPVRQESAKPETKPTTKKPKDRSIATTPELKPGVIDPTATAQQALDAAEVVGPAKAAAPRPASELSGFKSDLTNMGIGAAGLAAIVGTTFVAKKLYDRFTAPAPTPEVTPELTPHQQQLNDLEIQKRQAEINNLNAKTQKYLGQQTTTAPSASVPSAVPTSVESSALPQQNLTLEEVQQRLSTIPKAPQNTQNWPSGLPGQVQMPSNMTAVYGGAAPPAGSAAAVAPVAQPEVVVPEVVSNAAPVAKSEVTPVAQTSPVAPKKTKDTLTYKDSSPATWGKLTKEGITFLPGYGPGDNHLFNTFGAEGRKTVLDRFNDGKPIGSYENAQKLMEQMKKGVPSSEVPGLMAKLPAAEEAGNYGRLGKAMKVGGIAGLGIAAANLANAAEQAKAGQYGQAGGTLAETGSSFLPPWAQALMYSGEAGKGEAEDLAYRQRMEEAKKKGAGNRGQAYDPRKFYTPMGIPPY